MNAQALKNTTAPVQNAPADPLAPQVETPELKQSFAALAKRITSVVATIEKSHDEVQILAVDCLKHFDKYQDARPILNLIRKLPESFHRQGLAFWVSQNSPIRFPVDKEAPGGFGVKVRKEGDKDYTPLNLEKAEETAWHQVKETRDQMDRKIQPFSVMTVINSVLNLKRQLENTLQPDSKRAFDASYGNVNQTRSLINTLADIAVAEQAKANVRKAKNDAAKTQAHTPAEKGAKREFKLVKGAKNAAVRSARKPKTPKINPDAGEQPATTH